MWIIFKELKIYRQSFETAYDHGAAADRTTYHNEAWKYAKLTPYLLHLLKFMFDLVFTVSSWGRDHIVGLCFFFQKFPFIVAIFEFFLEEVFN